MLLKNEILKRNRLTYKRDTNFKKYLANKFSTKFYVDKLLSIMKK